MTPGRTTLRRAAATLCAGLLAACSKSDGQVVPCSESVPCAEGEVCDAERKVCVASPLDGGPEPCVPVGLESCGNGRDDDCDGLLDCDDPDCAGKPCASGGTCASLLCVAPTCGNGQADPGESDVDCGGACAPCGEGKSCAVAADCASNVCTAVKCVRCTVHEQCGPISSCRSSDGACARTCLAGQADVRSCGFCGRQGHACGPNGRWLPWGDCTGEGVCAAGDVELERCGACGARRRVCRSDCQWDAWGGCVESTCTGTEERPCGACGKQSRTCIDGCTWSPWGTCAGQGACMPSAPPRTVACGDARCTGTEGQTCSSLCQWQTTAACTGGTYNPCCTTDESGTCTSSCCQ